jgi:hypothetical protein
MRDAAAADGLVGEYRRVQVSHDCGRLSDLRYTAAVPNSVLTMNVWGASYVVTRYDGIEHHYTVDRARLNPTKHGVVELPLVRDTARVTACNSSIHPLRVLVLYNNLPVS